MTAGALALILPGFFGLILARRAFQLTNPLEYVPVGLTSGWLLNLISVNLLLRAGEPAEVAFHGAAVFLTACGALLWAVTRRPERENPKLSTFGWGYFLLFSLLVYFATVSILFLNPDDDFWLHTPMQAQILKGNFPIRNPVFPELLYGGHYARDLSIVTFSWWSGVNLYAAQAPVTAFLQLNAFWLIFAAGLRFGKSEWTAIFSSLFLFMGANAAGRGGWLDTVANNNPIAQAFTALLVFLFLKILFEKVDWLQVITTAILFSGLAWAYETSFVSFSFALVTFACLVLAQRALSQRQLQITACVVVVSLIFIGLQGGALGEFLEKLVSGGAAQSVEVDATTQAQNLEVSVKFPKEQMLQIKLTRPGNEISMAYYTFPWLRRFDISPQEPGYVSVLTPTVWRIHWLSLYLSPLVFFLLWRSRSRLGQLFWSLGFAAYFIPAVMDFGIWEVEVFRWEYAASCGFAAALGVALGDTLSELRHKLLINSSSQISIPPRASAWLMAGLLCWLNCYPSWVQLERRSAQLPSLFYGFLLPSTDTWMSFQPALGLRQADLDVGYAASKQVNRGQKFLMKRRALGPTDIFPESAFVGLMGGQTVGHSFPLQGERLGTMPFRQSSYAIAFWKTGDLDLLRNRELHWLYLKEDGSQPERLWGDGLSESYRETGPDGDHVIYKVEQTPFPAPTFSGTQHPEVRVDSISVEGADNLNHEEYRLLTAHATGVEGLDAPPILSYRFYEPETGELVPYEEGMSQTVHFGHHQFSFHFVAPHNPGKYLVKLFLGPSEVQHLVGEFEIETVQLKAFQDLKIEWLDPSRPLLGGLVETVKLRWRNPTGVELRVEGYASLTGASSSHPHPPQDFQQVNVTIPPRGERIVELKVVPPPEAGQWPFRLLLSPKDGKRTFQLPARVVGY